MINFLKLIENSKSPQIYYHKHILIISKMIVIIEQLGRNKDKVVYDYIRTNALNLILRVEISYSLGRGNLPRETFKF